MIIGVDSRIGFSFITGPSLLQNAYYVFQGGGMLSSAAKPADAISCSRNFSQQLSRLTALPEPIKNRFPLIHDHLCDQLESGVTSPLERAFEDYQRRPTVAGVAYYFGVLADLLEGVSGSQPKGPAKRS